MAGARPVPRHPHAGLSADGCADRRAGAPDLPGLRRHGPGGPTSLDDLLTETTDKELNLFKERVKGRGADSKKPADPETARASLYALIDHVIAGLSVRLSVHRERRQLEASMLQDLLAFDDSPDGELMRRYPMFEVYILTPYVSILCVATFPRVLTSLSLGPVRDYGLHIVTTRPKSKRCMRLHPE
jgi:hypothetical protein